MKKPKVINLDRWKQEKGIAPVGVWSVMDKSGKVVESGRLYTKKPRRGGPTGARQ